MKNKDTHDAAVALARKGVKKRHKGKSKKQISQFYRDLRSKRVDSKVEVLPN